MLPANTILFNRYRIVRELGHGGMGTVYEAFDQRVKCPVAVKETSGSGGSEGQKAFDREASLLGNLKHQSLPKVTDHFSENGGDFIVMEFISGFDLAELLESRGSPFPQTQVLLWADDLLRVLEYLHGQETPVLHRDIKPSNLKLTKEGQLFLLDFGLAKGAVGQMTKAAASHSTHGYTPIYASLEQILGQGTDARSDIYSLGATLYHLLAGVPPEAAPKRHEALDEDKPDPLQSIESLNTQASANVCGVIHKAMALSRKQRPISAARMRSALRDAVEEDERNSVEEEYRRAEARRRERDEKRLAEGAARRAEEERQFQEAETLKREREDSHRAEELERAEAEPRTEEETRTRVAQERQQWKTTELDDVEKEVPNKESKLREDEVAHTVAAPTVIAEPRAPKASSEAPVKTITATLPIQVQLEPKPVHSVSDANDKSNRLRTKLLVVMVIGALIAGALYLWRFTTKRSQPLDGKGDSPIQTVSRIPSAPLGMVYVPGGEFTMGRDDGDEYERPAHRVTVKPFFIDTYEVSNQDYKKFVDESGRTVPTDWLNRNYPNGASLKPVTGITWEDANAYAKWAGKRLPTEEEWEFAARGTDGRRYPWGNEWQSGLANADGANRGVLDVSAPKDASAFGAVAMVGNAWEWTASGLAAYEGGQLKTKPGADLKVIRGGSYDSDRVTATTTFRRGYPIRGNYDYSKTGFRCVKDLN